MISPRSSPRITASRSRQAWSASGAAVGAASSYVADSTPDRAALLHHRPTVAQACCSEAAEKVAGETIQLHDGIGITWEHDAHLVLRRAHALGQLFGAAHTHGAAVEL